MKAQTQGPQIRYNRIISYQKKVLLLNDYDICISYDHSEWLCAFSYESVAKFVSVKDILISYLLQDKTISELHCTESAYNISCVIYYNNGEKQIKEFSNVL